MDTDTGNNMHRHTLSELMQATNTGTGMDTGTGTASTGKLRVFDLHHYAPRQYALTQVQTRQRLAVQ
jgi:hypothetical protein